MTAVINISRKNLAVSKTLPNFVVPKFLISVKSIDFTGNRSNKAEFFLNIFSSQRDETLASFQKSFASFCIYISQIFRFKMPKSTKNLSRTAIGASCSTANVRKLVTSKTQQLSPTLYRITMQLFAPITGSDGRVRGCGISHTADCSASSQGEAIGLALISARAKYRAFDSINARSIILS